MTKTADLAPRMRREIVDALRALQKVGAVSPGQVRNTTVRMLGRQALPSVEAMTASEIAALRAGAGVSQAVLAAYMNVAAKTVSQWERGERQPTGAALKLLHVVKRVGLEALR